MSRLVKLLLLITIAVLIIQVGMSLFSDREGLLLRAILLVVGIAVYAFVSQVELKGPEHKR